MLLSLIKKSLLALLIGVCLSYWQEVSAQEHVEEASHEAHHEFKPLRLAVSIGHGYIPSASSTGTSFLIIPTFGLDVQYWFNPKWGLGLKSDIEVANYLVEGEEGDPDALVRENPLIVAIPLFFSPWENELTFIFGPGIEIESHTNFNVLRLGVGYEFEIGNHWDFAPEFIYDLKNGQINSFTMAIGIGKRF